MKIHDIFREGLLSDLRAIGQTAQRDVWGGPQPAELGRDPRQWAQAISKAAAGARQNANVLPIADTFTKAWDTLARNMVAHFIPQYQRVMTNPVYTIPDGHREKGIFIAANGQRSEVEYEWDSTTAAFVDPVTGDRAGARQMSSMIASAMEKVTRGSAQPEVDMDDLGRAGVSESQTLRRAMLAEGGNVFKDADGNPMTQRINQSDIPATVMWLEQLIGIDLPRERWLGSTGKVPTSGDLDIAIDANEISKEQMAARLTQWAQSHGLDPKQYVKKQEKYIYAHP